MKSEGNAEAETRSKKILGFRETGRKREGGRGGGQTGGEAVVEAEKEGEGDKEGEEDEGEDGHSMPLPSPLRRQRTGGDVTLHLLPSRTRARTLSFFPFLLRPSSFYLSMPLEIAAASRLPIISPLQTPSLRSKP